MLVTISSIDAIKVIEKSWKGLMKAIPNLPPAQILIETTKTKKRRTRGYFQSNGWQYSRESGHIIGINIDELSNAKELLVVLLHEAVHAINFENGVADVRGNYHNKLFKQKAIELGLEVSFMSNRHGFAQTFYTEGLELRYKSAFKPLVKAFNVGKARPVLIKKAGPSGHVFLFCECKPKRKISTTPSMYEKGAIVCSLCKTTFKPSQT